MKAAVFHELGKPLAIEDVPEPTPGPADLVVQVASCGICGTDLHSSSLPPGLPNGTVMGHEFAGEVVEVGPEARSEWKVGDRVCALPFIGCGHCAACLTGDNMHCPEVQTTGLGQVPGGYAELVRVGSGEALHLPESVSDEDGATVEPLSVGLHAVHAARLERGQNVLVIGAGPIGLATALWARFFGARVVAVSEKSASRLGMAAEFGATHGIHADKEDVATAFRAAAGAAPDVIFECVGVPGIIQQCIGLAPVRGSIVVVGVCALPDTILPVLAVIKELRIQFVVAYRKSDFAFTIDMLESGRVKSAPMVTDRVHFDTFADAFEALKHPTSQCKVLLDPRA
jgi:(R,R)-butanediol dehydrogenase/meso-butanediol dehydrogenase/diacetyl reductase